MSTSRKAPDVLVVGGGAIGLALALRLLESGASVRVLERDRPGGGATRAAGGMLAPLGEAPEPGPFLRAGLDSLARWPAFARTVEDASGTSVHFRRTGKLVVALDAAGVKRLRDRAEWIREGGHEIELLDGDAARRLEPGLAETVREALLLPSDSHVDNRRLGPALAAAVEEAGGRILTGSEVEGLRTRGGRAIGVRLQDGTERSAEVVVIAAGAWSGTLEGLPRAMPVRPVRGQMIRLRLDEPGPRRLVTGPGAYLIPSVGGAELVVGATEEEAGFDERTDPESLRGLHESAGRMFPALGDAERMESWAGLRPGSADDLPILGPDPEVGGLFWATGHYRNGILLTPFTAEVVAESILTGDLAREWHAFSPKRFLVLSGSGS